MDRRLALRRSAQINVALLSTSLRLVENRVVGPRLSHDCAVSHLLERALSGLDDVAGMLEDSSPAKGSTDAPSASRNAAQTGPSATERRPEPKPSSSAGSAGEG